MPPPRGRTRQQLTICRRHERRIPKRNAWKTKTPSRQNRPRSIPSGARTDMNTNAIRYQSVRTRRASLLAETIVSAIAMTRAFIRMVLARHRQRQQARAVYDALRQLDDRMLHDLGFDRSEI